MRSHRSLFAAGFVLAVAGCALQVRADVSAETDVTGTYLRTVVFANASVKNLRIWTVQKSRPLVYPLNPAGDLNGDLWPVIAENPYDANHPWVVWSRYTGAGYDLGWARWIPGGWSQIGWVEDAAAAAAGDDLDPNLAFGTDGRPHLVWWRNEGGIGRVYLSIFLVSRWMTAYPVSDVGADSRLPTVTVIEDGRIKVEYDTPDGHIVRIVVFSHPATITDDIDPFGRMTISPPPPSNSLGR